MFRGIAWSPKIESTHGDDLRKTIAKRPKLSSDSSTSPAAPKPPTAATKPSTPAAATSAVATKTDGALEGWDEGVARAVA